MKIYVTKYALSRGVFNVEAEVKDDNFAAFRDRGYPNYLHGEGRDWCRTKEQALAVAEQMRIKRIASLEQQINKLKMLTFAAGEGANV